MAGKKEDSKLHPMFESSRLEYDQLCQDWRHRDTMIWQSLAISISITGIILAIISQKGDSLLIVVVLALLSIILNLTILIKITKDHYYQAGSNELLEILGRDLQSKNDNKHDFRIHTPSRVYMARLKNAKKIPLPRLYEFVANKSAFKWFYYLQLVLVGISFLAFFGSCYAIMTNYNP